MPASNTHASYGSVTKTFHWLTALLILTAIPLGVIANWAPFETSEELARKAWLFSLHKTVGVSAFFVALARIVWALSQPKPASLHPERKLESFLAETVHWLLYGSLVLVPLSGWVHHAASSGFAPIWWPFGQDLPLVPKNESLSAAASGLHFVLVIVLATSIGLHIAGALKHHVIDRDATLRRMLPGSTRAGEPGQSHAKTPIFAALGIWAIALGLGSGLGLYQKSDAAPQTAALEQVQSDWQVESGTIEITTTQFGSAVTGSFAEWTAQITYTQSEIPGSHGSVRSQIAIGSLTLGSVTGQAMGPDFFDVSNHPTAEFVAELDYQADGYAAIGTLSLRGKQMPVRMPFTLEIDGDQARMTGKLTLDRRDFGIGDNLPDESSLAFGVEVNVSLLATRQ